MIQETKGVISLIALVFCLNFFLVSCDPIPEIRRIDVGDVRPPQLTKRVLQTNGTIQLDFDEIVSLRQNSLFLNDQGSGVSVNEKKAPPSQTLLLAINGNTIPGRQYSLELTVEDAHYNSLNIVMPFYGPNNHPAELVINEVLSASSTNNRDLVEIYVTKGGNIGGVTFFIGVPGDFDAAYMLPALEVDVGDFIILHCKPEGIAEEKDELDSNWALSGGKNASNFARDLWFREAPGLPDTSGILSIASSPIGIILDALFYSDKIQIEGKDYRSFGTKKLLDRAEKLQAAGAWKCKGTQIQVDDAARSDNITATRSLCRTSLSEDGDTLNDWHIVPSGQTSFGSINSNSVYEAASKKAASIKSKKGES